MGNETLKKYYISLLEFYSHIDFIELSKLKEEDYIFKFKNEEERNLIRNIVNVTKILTNGQT